MTNQPHLIIDRLWNGEEAMASERAEVRFTLEPSGLWVEIEARFHGDPVPALPPGPVDGLWDYEVVELFLANDSGHYLELEFGPHGHYLALQFSGVRQLQRRDIPLSYQTTIKGAGWQGKAQAQASCLPNQLNRVNAYAIHGLGQRRRYLAAHAVPGLRPDFHQPHLFQPW